MSGDHKNPESKRPGREKARYFAFKIGFVDISHRRCLLRRRRTYLVMALFSPVWRIISEVSQ
jgi:hypothetical protein